MYNLDTQEYIGIDYREDDVQQRADLRHQIEYGNCFVEVLNPEYNRYDYLLIKFDNDDPYRIDGVYWLLYIEEILFIDKLRICFKESVQTNPIPGYPEKVKEFKADISTLNGIQKAVFQFVNENLDTSCILYEISQNLEINLAEVKSQIANIMQLDKEKIANEISTPEQLITRMITNYEFNCLLKYIGVKEEDLTYDVVRLSAFEIIEIVEKQLKAKLQKSIVDWQKETGDYIKKARKTDKFSSKQIYGVDLKYISDKVLNIRKLEKYQLRKRKGKLVLLNNLTSDLIGQLIGEIEMTLNGIVTENPYVSPKSSYDYMIKRMIQSGLKPSDVPIAKDYIKFFKLFQIHPENLKLILKGSKYTIDKILRDGITKLDPQYQIKSTLYDTTIKDPETVIKRFVEWLETTNTNEVITMENFFEYFPHNLSRNRKYGKKNSQLLKFLSKIGIKPKYFIKELNRRRGL